MDIPPKIWQKDWQHSTLMNATTLKLSRRFGFPTLFLAAMASVIVSAIPARAQLLAYEGFNYTSGLDLVSQSVAGAGDSFGWAAPWGGANTALTTNFATSLSYNDGNGNSLITDGGSVVIGVPAGIATSAQITRSFNFGTLIGPAFTKYTGLTNAAGTYWVSFMMQWIGPQTAGSTTNLYVRKGDLVFRSGSNTNAPGTGGTEIVNVGSPNAGNRIGTTPDTWAIWRGPDAGGGTLNTGLATTSYYVSNSTFVLMRLDLDGTGAADTAYMWLNWTNLTIEPLISSANATNTSGNLDGLNNIRLDANGGNASGTNTVLAFDEFRFGTLFGDVSVVPEPTIFALAALGGVALFVSRRNKNRTV